MIITGTEHFCTYMFIPKFASGHDSFYSEVFPYRADRSEIASDDRCDSGRRKTNFWTSRTPSPTKAFTKNSQIVGAGVLDSPMFYDNI